MVRAEVAGGAEPPVAGGTIVLLRITQAIDGKPTRPTKGLKVWIARIEEAEPLHPTEVNLLEKRHGDDALAGWFAWMLPPGRYALAVTAYSANGIATHTLRDRFWFSIRDPSPALYLGSLAYDCGRSVTLKALCPVPGALQDDLAAAGSVAARLGAEPVISSALERADPPRPGGYGTKSTAKHCLDRNLTMLTVGEGTHVRRAYSFGGQAQAVAEGSVVDGTFQAIELATIPGGVFFIPILGAALGSTAGIQHHRLKNKVKCLSRIWDARADEAARDALVKGVQSATRQKSDPPGSEPASSSGGARNPAHERLLLLDLQRLEIDSCSRSHPLAMDPAPKRFCLQVAIRARVLVPDSREPESDEVFAFVPKRRVGHEFENDSKTTPPEYLYETPLTGIPTQLRTYHEYCDRDIDGFGLLEEDLRTLVGEAIPQILSYYCLSLD
jgi:hypothetical protein